MRTIDSNAVVLKNNISTFNTHVFTIVYGDGTGTECKVNVGDKISIKYVKDELVSVDECIFNKFESNIIYFTANNISYSIDYKKLIFIYNLTIKEYNFNIIKYKRVEDKTLPTPTEPKPSSTTTLSNTGTGVTLLSQVAANNFNIRSIKAGLGIRITTDGSTITITNTATSGSGSGDTDITMDEADLQEFENELYK